MTADRERLDAITARTAAATPGPWVASGRRNGFIWAIGPRPDQVGRCVARQDRDNFADAVFIAAARTDVEWLCDRVRDLTAENEAYQTACKLRLDMINVLYQRHAAAVRVVDAAVARANDFRQRVFDTERERHDLAARVDDLTQRLDAVRDWLKRADPYPELNGNKFAELRAALDGGAR